ncbi:hypothetical protein EKD04_025810, partial [Chloroflexales bacterium ZM16-3]|nr:hypothetical protein [Chloroflexales bacterium ZM16-3]
MDRFFESIDITAQLRNALRAVRSIPNGFPSLLLALIFGMSCYVLWPWIWFLDLDSTRAFGQARAAIVADAGVPFFDPAAFGWSLLGGLFLFTLIELGSPVLARFGVAPAAWLLWAAICVDSYTDYPRVAALMEPNRTWFVTEAGTFWGTGLFWVVRAGLLFVATIGLELAFVVLAVCAVALLLKTFMGGPRRAAVAT